MEKNIKQALQSACQALLRPVASVLMKSGMTWKEFSDLSKSVFVAVATDEFGIGGRPTNVSRASILTGISRKEVKRQRDLLSAPTPAASSKTTDATRLLSGWYQDPEYLDEIGQPRALPANGEIPSFEALFHRYGGDTPEQTLLKELINAGSVGREADGRLVPLRRYHMPVAMDIGGLRFFGNNLHDHARTLANNIDGDGADKRFEGFAVDDRLDPDAAALFRDFVDRKGQQYLEEIDAWLDAHRLDPADTDTQPIRLGLGVYAIEGQLPEGTQS